MDCGGQNCDLCCYDAFGGKPEFECAPVDDPPPNCGTDTVFDMTCDAKADCASGEVCCMERTKTSMLASATCRPKCPVSDNTTMHYELCGGDEECTAPKRCVKLPSLYFRVCR